MKKHLVFWLWNDRLTRRGIRNQLRKMAESGIGGVFFHAMPSDFSPAAYPDGLPGYLSKNWFAMVRYAVLTAAEFGMESWLYDEGGWPSGRANGIILKEHPEWALTVLRRNADNSGIERITFQDRPDLRQKEVVHRFIELTHEQYFKVLGDEFGKNVRGIFTDEPFFGNFQIIKTDWDNFGMPWTPDFPEAFQKQFHYSADEVIQKVFFGTPEESAQAIRESRDVLSKLAFHNYFGTLRKWCHDHHLLFTGHTGGEHMPIKMAQLYGDGFDMYREFDIPGLDTIRRQIFPAQHETDFPKYITSSARHAGKRRVFSESYAVYGYNCTFEEMRQSADAQYVLGVTDVIPMALYYSTRGARQLEHCCNLFDPDPRWKFYSDFAAYTRRAETLLSTGRMTAEVAVLLPYSAYLPPDKLNCYPDGIRFLQEHQISYDYVGEHELLRASSTSNCLKIGKVKYKVLAVPAENELTDELKERIFHLRKAGFPVVQDRSISHVLNFVQPDLPTGKNGESLRVLRLKRNEENFYFIFNAAKKPAEAICPNQTGEKWEWYDALTDTAIPAEPDANGTMIFELAGLSSVFLRKRTRKSTPHSHIWRHLPLAGKWERTMRKYYVYTDSGFRAKKYHAQAEDVCVDCGIFDFVNYFSCQTVPGQCKLVLDRRANGMWEIIVNGKNAGKTAWTPYSADISELIKKGKNRIVCRLTTPAGQVYHAPGIPEHLQRQGWVNDCLKTTLQFSAPPLPEINDLPSFLLIPAEREGGEKC